MLFPLAILGRRYNVESTQLEPEFFRIRTRSLEFDAIRILQHNILSSCVANCSNYVLQKRFECLSLCKTVIDSGPSSILVQKKEDTN